MKTEEKVPRKHNDKNIKYANKISTDKANEVSYGWICIPWELWVKDDIKAKQTKYDRKNFEARERAMNENENGIRVSNIGVLSIYTNKSVF